MVVESQSRAKNISIFNRPKRPSHAALSGEHPLRDIERTSFAPSTAPFMVNYTVDDMDAMVARLRAKGVEILKRDESDDNGRFAWIVHPEGNKVELWQPKRANPSAP